MARKTTDSGPNGWTGVGGQGAAALNDNGTGLWPLGMGDPSRSWSRPEDQMQAFFYRHLVPMEDLVVGVSGPARRQNPVRVAQPLPVRIPVGGTARVRLIGAGRMLPGGAQLELDAPPKGIALQSYHPIQGGVELVMGCDAAHVQPGMEGNLLVRAFTAGRPDPGGRGELRRTVLGWLPAIPFEVAAVNP